MSRLLADAAASPLTHHRNSVSASVGIAYRCCKP
jgi:outer membrane scaffolding protein for murein synthesis (MipA/OmpV family)